MAKRLFFASQSFVGSAAGAQATSGAYMSIVGGSATQLIDILELLVSGQAAASALGGFCLTRQSTLGTGGNTAIAAPTSDGPMNSNTAALAAVPVTAIAYVTNQVIPSAATTDSHLNLGLNTFGGILRWNAAPFQQWTQYGSAVTVGASVLYNSTSYFGATANANAHMMYEPY
jgi:hypothetical protein